MIVTNIPTENVLIAHKKSHINSKNGDVDITSMFSHPPPKEKCRDGNDDYSQDHWYYNNYTIVLRFIYKFKSVSN